MRSEGKVENNPDRVRQRIKTGKVENKKGRMGTKHLKFVALVFCCVLVAASCGSSHGRPLAKSPVQLRHLPQVKRPNTATSKFPLISHSAQRLVDFYIQAGVNNGFNFDGDTNGKLELFIPLGWTVNIQCHNSATSLYHSCAVTNGANSTTPAFPGASVPNPQEGIDPGGTASFTFVASQAGTFRIACLLPGHEEAGMWGKVIISSSITDPELLS